MTDSKRALISVIRGTQEEVETEVRRVIGNFRKLVDENPRYKSLNRTYTVGIYHTSDPAIWVYMFEREREKAKDLIETFGLKHCCEITAPSGRWLEVVK